MLRSVFLLFLCFMPWRVKRYVYEKIFNFKIHKAAKIGFSLILSDRLEMGESSKIGHLNVVKGVEEISLGESASIGSLNWISGFPRNSDSHHFADQASRSPVLVLGAHAAITNRHLIDCTDSVSIGRYSTFAGFRSQILTHSISIADSRQRSGPVVIGDYAFVGTGTIILPNACLPSFSVLGAGSVLNKAYCDEYFLYAGNPARPVKSLDKNSAYFARTSGYVI